MKKLDEYIGYTYWREPSSSTRIQTHYFQFFLVEHKRSYSTTGEAYISSERLFAFTLQTHSPDVGDSWRADTLLRSYAPTIEGLKLSGWTGERGVKIAQSLSRAIINAYTWEPRFRQGATPTPIRSLVVWLRKQKAVRVEYSTPHHVYVPRVYRREDQRDIYVKAAKMGLSVKQLQAV